MRDNDSGIVPVVDDERSRKLVGVVTDRDLCMTSSRRDAIHEPSGSPTA